LQRQIAMGLLQRQIAMGLWLIPKD